MERGFACAEMAVYAEYLCPCTFLSRLALFEISGRKNDWLHLRAFGPNLWKAELWIGWNFYYFIFHARFLDTRVIRAHIFYHLGYIDYTL